MDSPDVRVVGAKTTCSEEGVSLKGWRSEKHVAWGDIAKCSLDGKILRLFWRKGPDGCDTEVMDIPAAECSSVMRYPSFPRWMLSPEEVTFLKDPSLPSALFGPPTETTWVDRTIPTQAETVDFAVDPLRGNQGYAWVTGRVGLFGRGAAFVRVLGTMEVCPWKFVELVRYPSKGLLLASWMRPEESSLGWAETNEVDAQQATAILTYPSGRAWDLPNEIWKGLGLAPPLR